MGANLCKPACCCMNSKVKPKHSRSTSRKSPRRPRRQPSSLDRRPYVDGTGDDESAKSPTTRKRKSKRERRDENIRGKSQTVGEMAPPPHVGGADAPFTNTDSVHHATSDNDDANRTDAYHDDSRRAAQLRHIALLSPMTPTNYFPSSSMPFDDRCSPDIYDTDEDKFPEHQRRHRNEPSYIDAPSARLIDDDATTIISGPSEVDPLDDEFDRSPASPFGGEKSVNDGDFASCLTEAREAPSLSQRYRSDTQLGNRPYADTRTGSVGGGDSSREGWAEASPQYPQDDAQNVFSSNSGSLSGSLSTGSCNSSSSLSPTGSNRSGAASPRDVGPLANERTRNESSVRTRLEETVVSSRRRRPSTASLSSATTTVSLDDPFSDTSEEMQCDASANGLQTGAHVQASFDRHKQLSTTTREPQLAVAPPPTARRVSMEARLLMKIDEMFNAMSQQHSDTAIHPRQRHSFYSATNRDGVYRDDDDGVLRIPSGCAALLKYLSPEQEHRRMVYRDSVFNKSEPISDGSSAFEAVCHRCTCCGVCTRHVHRCFMTGATHGGVHLSIHHVGGASVVCSLTPSRGWMDSMFATEDSVMGASALSVAVDDVYCIVASIAPDWADVVMSVLSPRCEAIVEALAWSGATSDSLLLPSQHGSMTFVLHLTEDTGDDCGGGLQRSTSQGWSVGAQVRSSPPTPSSSMPPPTFSSRVIQRCREAALNKAPATMLQHSHGLVLPAGVGATKVTDDERKRLFEVIRIYAEDRRGAAASWPARRGRWSQLTIGPPPPCAASPLEPANAVFGHTAEVNAQPGYKNNNRASTIPIAYTPGGPPSLAPQRILRPQAAIRPAARGDVGLVRARHNFTAEHAGAKLTRAPANPPNSGALRLG